MEKHRVATRTALWFALTTVVSFVILTAASSFLLQDVLSQEIGDSEEAFEATRELIETFRDEPRQLEEVLETLFQSDSPPPEGFRIWRKYDGVCVREFDPFGILAEIGDLPREPGEALRLDEGLVWHVGHLDDQHVAGALLGISNLDTALGHESREIERVELIEHYHMLLGWFLAIAALVALLVGWTLGSRIGSELDQVKHAQARTHLLTAGLAHELGAPMQNMLGEAEVALALPRDANRYRSVLESQLEEIHALAHTVDNLVTLSALNHEGPTRADPVDITEVLSSAMTREQDRAEQQTIKLQVVADGDTVLVGDRAALELAVRNIISNAVRFSPRGGSVVARVQEQPNALVISIEDSGPGVPLADREAIFEPLRTGQPAPGERSGYGLGLALARSAIERHGGSIHVEDATEGGARFVLQLPRRLT